MNPATVAIVPLVLAVAGAFAGWYHRLREDEGDDPWSATGWGLTFTGISVLGFLGLAYLTGVVVFGDWEFLQ